MEGTIVLRQKEVHRGSVVDQVMRGAVSLEEAAGFLRVSYRQAKRLKATYGDKGLAGMAHGHRGRRPVNVTPDRVVTRVRALAQGRYAAFNDVHLTEMLREREGIVLSREKVRGLLRAAGKGPKRKRRPPQHRSRRPRKPQRGMMVQWDGSPHQWFGPEQPPCCLMAVVDDADSRLLAGLFVPAESSAAYLRVLDNLLHRHGAPWSVYHDRHTSLVRSDDFWSLEEQLQGQQYPTHVGRVLEEVGIRSISARSPQAKGRIERGFGTLQDRLIAELALEGIRDLDTANTWLEKAFIDRYNRRFAQSPADPESVFRKCSPRQRYEAVCYAYEATVGNDNCIRLGGLLLDVPPGKPRRSFAGQRVLVKHHLDGAWSVWRAGVKIAAHGPTPFHEPLRSWKQRHRRDDLRGRTALQVYLSSKPVMAGGP